MRDSRDAITGILYAVAVSAVLWALLFSALARGQVRGEIGAGALAALARVNAAIRIAATPRAAL